jgi:hypothetical protein
LGLFSLWTITPLLFSQIKNNTKDLKINLVSEFKALKKIQNISLFITIFLLSIILYIHFLLFFVSRSPLFIFGNSDWFIYEYVSQVFSIIGVIAAPFVLLAGKILRLFKIRMFSILSLDNNLLFEERRNSRFTDLENISFVSEKILCDCEDTTFGEKNRKYNVLVTDDVLYIKNKNVYFVEANIQNRCEEYDYQRTKDGGYFHWIVKWKEPVFNGLVIVFEKTPNDEKNGIFKVDNKFKNVSSETSRENVKHGFFYSLLKHQIAKVFKKDELIDDDKFNVAKKNGFSRLYENHNPEINKIAAGFNCDWISETNTQIYLFHSEPNIDFFSFYANKSVEKNIYTFQKDMELILNAVDKLPDYIKKP